MEAPARAVVGAHPAGGAWSPILQEQAYGVIDSILPRPSLKELSM